MTDSANAEHAATDRSARRTLLGAGVVGAALALATSRPAAASAIGNLSEGDMTLAAFAIGLELTASELYVAAIGAGAEGAAWQILSDQHRSYADRIAGIAGISADTRNEAVYAALEGEFTGSHPANAAFGLENTAAATHIEMLRTIADADFADAVASIVSMESRHAAFLAERSGRGDNFDALFSNSATPLEAGS